MLAATVLEELRSLAKLAKQEHDRARPDDVQTRSHYAGEHRAFSAAIELIERLSVQVDDSAAPPPAA